MGTDRRSLTTGFATSVIEATAEAAIERAVPADQTPDKRPGVLIQFTIETDLNSNIN